MGELNTTEVNPAAAPRIIRAARSSQYFRNSIPGWKELSDSAGAGGFGIA
jgi:hypothetical protein